MLLAVKVQLPGIAEGVKLFDVNVAAPVLPVRTPAASYGKPLVAVAVQLPDIDAPETGTAVLPLAPRVVTVAVILQVAVICRKKQA
jgi:hypothetical protein